MQRHVLSLWLILLFVCISNDPASGQWSTYPAENVIVTDRAAAQVIPIPVVTSDGGCYFGWFDQGSGNYDVYLQRFDRNGYAQWAPNGILVSDHAQSSSLVTWDMTVDEDDNAILVFSDSRAGFDLDNYAYKVSPSGELLWGPDGITLSDNNDYEPGAAVVVAGDGDAVFVWSRFPEAGDGAIFMQRLSPAGIERFAHGGIPVAEELGTAPGFPDIVAADDGSVIVSWVKDLSSFYSDRHLRAEQFSNTGLSVWGDPTTVYDAGSVPLGYHPHIQSDGNGGMVWAWHASEGNLHQSRFQHLDAAGGEAFSHNGVKVTTLAGQHHIDPALAYHPVSGDAYVFWNERNSSQSQWGIYAQRIAPDGTLLWGNHGQVLLPVSTLYRSYPRAVPCEGGAMVFVADEPTGAYGEDRLIGMRVDSSGNQVWPGSVIEVSSLLSDKSRYPTVINSDDMAILVWEDDRAGSVDLYAQNVNLDGTLGVDVSDANGNHAPRWIPFAQNSPNPFRYSTRFAFNLAPDAADSHLLIYDSNGRTLRAFQLSPSANGETVIEWRGNDDAGTALPGGVYFYQLVGPDGVARKRRRAILLR